MLAAGHPVTYAKCVVQCELAREHSGTRHSSVLFGVKDIRCRVPHIGRTEKLLRAQHGARKPSTAGDSNSHSYETHSQANGNEKCIDAIEMGNDERGLLELRMGYGGLCGPFMILFRFSLSLPLSLRRARSRFECDTYERHAQRLCRKSNQSTSKRNDL